MGQGQASGLAGQQLHVRLERREGRRRARRLRRTGSLPRLGRLGPQEAPGERQGGHGPG